MAQATFTLTFEGLCAFVERGTASVEVYLPYAHGEHGANLLIPSRYINEGLTTWRPTRVALYPEGVLAGSGTGPTQFAIWDLHREDSVFTDGAGIPTWSNKIKAVDFAKVNPGSRTRSKAEIRAIDSRAGIVTLFGASSKLTASAFRDYVFKKPDGWDKDDNLGQLVQWKPVSTPTIKNRAQDVIVFRQPDEGERLDIVASISNVAPVSHLEGLAHFHHYYLGAVPAGSDPQATIEDRFADVFDCVPPAAWAPTA